MDKLILERLHLYNIKTSKEKYLDLLEKMNSLDLPTIKKFHFIYENVLNIIEGYLNSKDEFSNYKIDLKGDRSKDIQYLKDDDKISKFLDSRIMENDGDRFIDNRWKIHLQSIKDNEIDKLNNYDLIEACIYSHTLMCLIDSLIVKKDEYWMPRNIYTVFLLKESGYSFEKEKERIWQPK